MDMPRSGFCRGRGDVGGARDAYCQNGFLEVHQKTKKMDFANFQPYSPGTHPIGSASKFCYDGSYFRLCSSSLKLKRGEGKFSTGNLYLAAPSIGIYSFGHVPM